MDKSVEGQDDSEGLNLHEVVGDFDLAAGNDGPQQFKQDVSEALNLLDPSDRDLLVDKYIVGLKQREMEEKYQKKSMGVVIRRALRRALNIFERNGFSPSYWSYPATTTQYIEEDESIYEDEAHDEALIVIKGNPDINGDGRVDLDDLREFRRIIKLMRDSNNGLKEEEKSQLDINGDGIVDERDFIALGMEVLRAGITPKDGAISLEKGDLNSDGKINQDDLDLLRLKLEAQEAGDSLPVEAVKLLDVNGDGRLDENDFIDLSLMVLANEVDEEREKGLMDLVQNNVLLKREFDLIEMDAKDFSKALNLDVIDDAAVEIPNGIETKLLADFLKKTAEEG